MNSSTSNSTSSTFQNALESDASFVMATQPADASLFAFPSSHSPNLRQANTTFPRSGVPPPDSYSNRPTTNPQLALWRSPFGDAASSGAHATRRAPSSSHAQPTSVRLNHNNEAAGGHVSSAANNSGSVADASLVSKSGGSDPSSHTLQTLSASRSNYNSNNSSNPTVTVTSPRQQPPLAPPPTPPLGPVPPYPPHQKLSIHTEDCSFGVAEVLFTNRSIPDLESPTRHTNASLMGSFMYVPSRSGSTSPQLVQQESSDHKAELGGGEEEGVVAAAAAGSGGSGEGSGGGKRSGLVSIVKSSSSHRSPHTISRSVSFSSVPGVHPTLSEPPNHRISMTPPRSEFSSESPAGSKRSTLQPPTQTPPTASSTKDSFEGENPPFNASGVTAEFEGSYLSGAMPPAKVPSDTPPPPTQTSAFGLRIAGGGGDYFDEDVDKISTTRHRGEQSSKLDDEIEETTVRTEKTTVTPSFRLQDEEDDDALEEEEDDEDASPHLVVLREQEVHPRSVGCCWYLVSNFPLLRRLATIVQVLITVIAIVEITTEKVVWKGRGYWMWWLSDELEYTPTKVLVVNILLLISGGAFFLMNWCCFWWIQSRRKALDKRREERSAIRHKASRISSPDHHSKQGEGGLEGLHPLKKSNSIPGAIPPSSHESSPTTMTASEERYRKSAGAGGTSSSSHHPNSHLHSSEAWTRREDEEVMCCLMCCSPSSSDDDEDGNRASASLTIHKMEEVGPKVVRRTPPRTTLVQRLRRMLTVPAWICLGRIGTLVFLYILLLLSISTSMDGLIRFTIVNPTGNVWLNNIKLNDVHMCSIQLDVKCSGYTTLCAYDSFESATVAHNLVCPYCTEEQQARIKNIKRTCSQAFIDKRNVMKVVFGFSLGIMILITVISVLVFTSALLAGAWVEER